MKIAIIGIVSFFLITMQSCKKLDRDNLLDINKNEKTLNGINLSISKFEITADDNNDQIANKNETISLKLYIKNKGIKKANNVKASINCKNTFVSSLSPTSALSYSYYNYNFLEPDQESSFGGSGVASNTLTFKISNSTPNGTILSFDVTITDSDNHTWTDVFTITVGSTNANIEFSRYEITSDNNSDQIINKGEDINLKVYLKNTGASQANKVTATISCSNSYISNLTPTTALNYDYNSTSHLNSGQESTSGGSPNSTKTLSFKVSNSTPNGTILTFNIAIVDESGNTWSDVFTITVGSTNANIEFSRYEITSDNNSDQIINKGEDINLKVYLKNTGASQANKVTATISCSNSYISNLTPTTALNYDYPSTTHLNAGQESASGGSPNSTKTLSFKVSNSTPNGTVLTFNIEIVDESGNTWTDSFTITVGSTTANIEFSRYEISSDNNNDKIVNKGEKIDLMVYLKNTGTIQVNSVTAKITSSNNYVSNLTPTTELNYDSNFITHLKPGQESVRGGFPNYTNTLSFNVSNSTPNGTILTFNIAIVDESGNTWTDSFTLTVNSTDANIEFSRFEISSDNNKDKIVNKGESINLNVYLKNNGTSQANSVTATISCSNSYVSNLTPTTELNYDYNFITHLDAGQESVRGGFPNYPNTLSFNVSNSTPTGTVLTFSISIVDESNNTWQDSFLITVN